MSTPDPAPAPRPLVLPDGRPAAAGWSLDPAVKHLNHGSFGAVPLVAQQEQNRRRRQMEASPVEWFPALPEKIAAARGALARFLRVRPDDLALVPNASAGASVVYGGVPTRPGGEVLVTDHGYGAVTMGAERLARRWGGTLRTAHVPLDADADTAYACVVDAIGAATGLVVIDHITSATARWMPVGRIAAEARRRGVPVLVDGAHVPGLAADPLAGVDCDVWVGNLHKFGCAPRGTAALVARTPLRDHLYPLIDSWGAPAPFPDRFDTQGTIDATGYLAAPTALDFVADTWGWDPARTYMRELADYAERIVAAAFSELTGEDCRVDVGTPVDALRLVRLPAPLAATHAEADALRDRVGRELGVAAAFTSFGGVGYLRLSTHVYNTAADFEYFAEHCVPVLGAWSRTDSPRRTARNARKAAAALGLALTLAATGCSALGGAGDGTVTLQMVESLTNPTRTELLKRLVDDCEKQNPTIRVNVVSPPTAQADQKIQQMLQSGSGVDTVEVRDITVGPWSDNDWLHDVGPDLNGFISSLNIDRGSMSAAAVLTILPTMVLFAFASRHVVAGLTAGAVKG